VRKKRSLLRRHHLPLGGLRFAFCSTSGIVRLVSCSGLSKGVALADGNNQLPQLSLSTLNYPASIWLYVRFGLSLRNVEDLLAERGIEVSYETVRC
jgi:hypothetical protein